MAGGAFTRTQREAIWSRAAGHCEVCGCRLPEKGWNAHHRRNRGMGGTRRPVTLADGLAVCGSGTTGCHGYITEHHEWATQRGYVVSKFTDPAAVPVFIRGAWKLLTQYGYEDGPEWMEVPA